MVYMLTFGYIWGILMASVTIYGIHTDPVGKPRFLGTGLKQSAGTFSAARSKNAAHDFVTSISAPKTT